MHCDIVGRFPVEWAITSAHKVRSPDDMQFAFSYYYYVLGAINFIDIANVFDELDTDHSGWVFVPPVRTGQHHYNAVILGLCEIPLHCKQITY